jgi:hypothetical protein
MLSACPAAGGGVHLWLFRMARVLHPFFEDKSRIAEMLAQASAGCGREVPESEILSAIANSQACAWQPRGKLESGRDRQPVSRPVSIETANPSLSAWPQRNDEQIEAVVAASDVAGLADLWEASPLRPDWEESQTEELIDALFPGNPLLCCGKHINRGFGTGTREEWRGQLAVQQFIVPSPMTE